MMNINPNIEYVISCTSSIFPYIKNLLRFMGQRQILMWILMTGEASATVQTL